MKLYIDTREPTFIKDLVPKFFESENTEIECEIKELETGDFIYDKLVIERKEISDFCNSVTTQRMASQKARLGAMIYEGYTPYVIITGTMDTVFQGALSKRGYAGAIASLNEHSIHTINLEDCSIMLFCETIYALIRHYNSEKPLKEPFIVPKVESFTQKVLMCIDGIGEEMAKNIITEYSDDLNAFYNINKDTLKQCLLEVTGIGEVKAETIVTTLRSD